MMEGPKKNISEWFKTVKCSDWLYVTTEPYFTIDNRANIWLVKGANKDVVIDTGLGVCDLKAHLEKERLIDTSARQCDVICTHAHFDHSGGAHHFDNVYIHELESNALMNAQQQHTLNYVKNCHFHQLPFDGFRADRFRVPPTQCRPLRHGDKIDLGDEETLEVIHTPGHTEGSISLYLTGKNVLFTGDFLYDCGNGAYLLDWLPTSNRSAYLASAQSMIDFMTTHRVEKVCPGHFNVFSASRAQSLLREYVTDRSKCGSFCVTGCVRALTSCYFATNCFRCCP